MAIICLVQVFIILLEKRQNLPNFSMISGFYFPSTRKNMFKQYCYKKSVRENPWNLGSDEKSIVEKWLGGFRLWRFNKYLNIYVTLLKLELLGACDDCYLWHQSDYKNARYVVIRPCSRYKT